MGCHYKLGAQKDVKGDKKQKKHEEVSRSLLQVGLTKESSSEPSSSSDSKVSDQGENPVIPCSFDQTCGLLKNVRMMGIDRKSDRRGGGVRVMYKANIKVKELKSGEFSSFEYSLWSVLVNTTHVLKIYRPPYSANQPVTCSTFIAEFADFIIEVYKDGW